MLKKDKGGLGEGLRLSFATPNPFVLTSTLCFKPKIFFVFNIFYHGSQSHIQSTYIYTYSLSPKESRNTNLIIAQFICNTVQRQVSSNQKIITLTYIMFCNANHIYVYIMPHHQHRWSQIIIQFWPIYKELFILILGNIHSCRNLYSIFQHM